MADKKPKSKKDKTKALSFPPDSCGACHYCKALDDDMVRDQIGFCYALPPYPIPDGSEVAMVRPTVEWSEPTCRLFLPRNHA